MKNFMQPKNYSGAPHLKWSIVDSLIVFWRELKHYRRVQLVLLVGLMFVVAIAEMLSIGAMVPFLAILADSGHVSGIPIVSSLLTAFGLDLKQDLRWQISAAFAAVIVAAGAVRILLIFAQTRINFGIGHELGTELYRRTLYQPYDVHLLSNSAEIRAGLAKVDEVTAIIYIILGLINAALMVTFVIAALLVIDPVVAGTVFISVGTIYLSIMLLVRKPLAANNETMVRLYAKRLQLVDEGLGGIRDVLLDHTQERFSDRFGDIDWTYRRAERSNYMLYYSPRVVVEVIAMLLVVALTQWLTGRDPSHGLTSSIPILGALALGAQRLIPAVQHLYLGWSSVVGQKGALEDVARFFTTYSVPATRHRPEPSSFLDAIQFQTVSFKYRVDGPDVVHDINLRIGKGQRVGLIGNTGSGKSTMIDLLMGLLEPSAGQIMVDGVPLTGRARLMWQAHIGHVSQSLYLADCSIAENIAFGEDTKDFDYPRIRAAARQAQIDDYIASLPSGYQTRVGERGVRLSGGQRQRIGIARALYKNADVLVFDEATSALDVETERAVMSALASLSSDITIIQVAHRISTLSNCDLILELRDGKLVRICSYSDLASGDAKAAL
jgi:ABC-type multidrug transport system fused ATPase/permease subunit